MATRLRPRLKFVLLLAIFVIGSKICKAQNSFNIIEGPNVSLPCSTTCVTLHSSYQQKLATSFYNFSIIPFATSTLSAPTVLSLGDDNYSTAIPIGFSFCFYNQLYSNIYISSNGILTFNSAYSNGSCSFDTKTAIAYFNSTYADNAIFGPFMDLKPSAGGTIQYQTIGTSPNRKFVVQYNNLKLFGSTCSNTTSTFEIVLHELSNFIDFQITNKQICDADTANYLNFATIGIQSNGASNFQTIPGKNASIWTANNLGYRILPSGGPSYTTQWIENGVIINTNPDSIAICGGPYPRTIIGQISYSCPSIILQDTIVISQQSGAIDSINFTRPTCKYSTNGTLTVYTNNFNTPYTYSIDNLPFVSTNVFTGLDTGWHTVVAKDVTGCIQDTSIYFLAYSYLKVNEDSTLEASCDSIADGYTSVIANLGIQPYTYLWSNGGTGTSIGNVYGGTAYKCIVTDSIGCKDSMSIYVPQHQLTVLLDSLHNSVCPQNNGYISIYGTDGTAPYSYLWTTGDTTSIIDSLAPNNYNVTVTDSLGCFKTTTFIVGVDSLPLIGFNYTDNVCEFDNGTVSAIVTGGTPQYAYLWSTGATTSSIGGLDSGIYIVTVTDSKGCVNTAFKVIDDTLKLVTNHVSTPTTCGLSNGMGSILAMSGLQPYSYTWSNGGTTSIVNNLASGLNICTTVDMNGCTRFDTIFIASSTALVATSTMANANCDSANGSIYVVPINGSIPFTYLWSDGQTTSNAVGLASNQFYVVTVTDNANCVFMDTFFIANDGKPQMTVTSYIEPTCHGDSTGTITLSGFLGVSPYKYSVDGINFATSATLTNITGGLYYFYIKDANSCVNEIAVFLSQPPKMLFNYNIPDSLICYTDIADAVTVNTSGGYPPYLYSLNNGVFQSNNIFSNLAIGNYTITISDSVKCMRDIEFSINGPEQALQLQFQKTDVPCFQKNTGKLSVLAIGGWEPYNYFWSDSTTNPINDSLSAGVYSVSVIDAKGCKQLASLEVKQLSCCEIKVPTAFTPNGDTYNDFLKLVPLSTIVELQFAIYNRQGQKVFETNDVNIGWDGKLHEKEMATETYYYYLRYKCATEDNFILQRGDITLIR
jgi:gliding motility-associated-like protein